jgi:5-methylcytosine-specific restriction endonuclease McrBC GTP-binding regulatory subunit McrB
LYEALTKVNILQWLPQNRIEETMEMTTKAKMEQIKAYIAGKGFTYEDGMIENFWLCLKSKPFVILAGISGTGKTRLVKLFADAIGAEYRLVPVRPDWSDSSDLLGHNNPDGEFVPGRVLKIILEAMNEPEKPFILCLDEMNLARVEYYLSDFLSVIETRDLIDGKIVSDRLLPYSSYGDIRFPENLYLVGTVNMDETTFPFSKKVLDRANTIEFNTVCLMPSPETPDGEAEPIEAGNDFLKSEYLFLSRCLNEENQAFIESVCSDLEQINRVLMADNAHVGYRVRDEIVFYMLNNRNAGLLSRDEALDNAIMQKILPRIQGSSASVKHLLCELFKIFAGDFEGYQTRNNDTADGMFDRLGKGNIRYPKSAAKTAFMVRRFDEDGFTAFWL